mmetsp:Transcript_11711/g.13462  ORF Transcript_11711/g.13462 Transcript_11711/m.13462 type:complete len:146 (-) Transcript_11711:2047-2484(-)
MLRVKPADLQRYSAETVEWFLLECETLIKAIKTRQQLGDWDKALYYQEILHKKLEELANVADAQAFYGDRTLRSLKAQENTSADKSKQVEEINMTNRFSSTPVSSAPVLVTGPSQGASILSQETGSVVAPSGRTQKRRRKMLTKK